MLFPDKFFPEVEITIFPEVHNGDFFSNTYSHEHGSEAIEVFGDIEVLYSIDFGWQEEG